MKPENLTIGKIKELIQKSGFPLELQVAEQFIKAGYEIKPSYLFFDPSRGKDEGMIARFRYTELYKVLSASYSVKQPSRLSNFFSSHVIRMRSFFFSIAISLHIYGTYTRKLIG